MNSSARSGFRPVTIAVLTSMLFHVSGAGNLEAAELKKPGPSPSDALFDPSRVIQIEIRLDPKDWHELRVSHPKVGEDGFIAVAEKGYAYFKADMIVDGTPVKSVGVRKKGSWGSADSSRPSFRIKFDEYRDGQEFAGLDSLILNNLILDSTKAQQFLVCQFMSRAGVPAQRGNLARVIVNGEDLGVYGQIESIGKRFIKRHFTDAKGDLYEGEQGDFTEDKADRVNRFERIVHKWGPDKDRNHLRQLMALLGQPEPPALDQVAGLVDLDSFIRLWAAEVLIGSHDSYSGSRNNYFVYRDSTSGKLHFLPWGRDVAFGYPSYVPETVPKSVWAVGILCKRLWQFTEIRQRYRAEMRRLLSEVWSETSLRAELDRLRLLIEPYRAATLSRGDDSSRKIISFVDRRRNEIEAELKAPAPDWPELPLPPPVARLEGPAMQVEGSFVASIMDRAPTNSIGLGSADFAVTVGGAPRKPLVRFGATAFPATVGQLDLMGIQLDGFGSEPGERLRFRMNLDPYRLVPGRTEFDLFGLWGRLTQGDPQAASAPTRSPRQIKGTLELTQVSTNLGGTISGKFKIHTTAFEEEKKP